MVTETRIPATVATSDELRATSHDGPGARLVADDDDDD